MRDTEFDLYRTAKGPVCITTPAHRRILNALQEGERSFSEVVDATGKAKSTVSIHLNRMVDEGLVSAREDEEDARRRWFSLVAEPVLTASPDLVVEGHPDADQLDSEGILLRLASRISGAGLDVAPLFRSVGRDVGQQIRADRELSPEDATEEAVRYWSKWGLGNAEANAEHVEVDPANWLEEESLHASSLFQGFLEGLADHEAEVVDAGATSFTVGFDG